MNEIWECRDCFREVSLDEHGRCSGCGSEAVMPLAVVEKGLELWTNSPSRSPMSM
jgi:rRNA maturation endonuclease Nob1